MPVFNFFCEKCQKPARKILSPEEARALVIHDCGYVLKRVQNPPSSQVTETLDNGIMPKKLERYANAEELYKERSEKSDKRSGS